MKKDKNYLVKNREMKLIRNQDGEIGGGEQINKLMSKLNYNIIMQEKWIVT